MGNSIYRTVQVKLSLSDDRATNLLHQTKNQFNNITNQTANWAWRQDDHCITNKTKAKNNLYDEFKEETELQAQLVQNAIDHAIDAVSSGVEKIKNGEPTSKPEFTAWNIVYDKRSATFNDESVSLATVDGRVECDYNLPSKLDGTPHEKYLLNDDFEEKEGTLHYNEMEDEFYLHVQLASDNYEAQESRSHGEGAVNPTVLGVDLNVTGGFAVTSTGEFIGSADHLNHKRDEYEKRRGDLQQVASHNAHKTLKSVSSRFNNWSEGWLHCRANELLEEAKRVNADVIAFEDLEGIRERMGNGKKFQQWMFAEFQRVVGYKAEEYDFGVAYVDPVDTSKSCSKCGFTADSNRLSKHEFECGECGFEVNADYNAARNVGFRFLQSGQTSQVGGATCQLALKSGTLGLSKSSTGKPTDSSVGD